MLFTGHQASPEMVLQSDEKLRVLCGDDRLLPVLRLYLFPSPDRYVVVELHRNDVHKVNSIAT